MLAGSGGSAGGRRSLGDRRGSGRGWRRRASDAGDGARRRDAGHPGGSHGPRRRQRRGSGHRPRSGGCRRPSQGYRRVGIEHYFHAPQVNGLTGQECSFLHRRAIDEGAVGGTEVADHHFPALDYDLTVGARYRGILQLEVVGRAAPQRVGSRLELDLLGGRRTGLDDE